MWSDLVFDVGAHDGADTARYLAMGFNVVAVEANPVLADRLREQFADSVSSGKLVVCAVGIHTTPGVALFYVSSNDLLSSFNQKQATQYGESATAVEVPLVTFQDLLEQFGVPYYLKIDIEGMDHIVIDALRGDDLPVYLSTEIDRRYISTVRRLSSLGYDRFKLIRQRDHRPATPLSALRDRVGGSSAVADGHSSGPFGPNTPGWWLPTVAELGRAVGFRGLRGLTNFTRWHDLHAWRRDSGRQSVRFRPRCA